MKVCFCLAYMQGYMYLFTLEIGVTKGALEKTTCLSEEKKNKWREVLSPVFISSKESGIEQTENGAQSVLYVKPLKWRSPCVSSCSSNLITKLIR